MAARKRDKYGLTEQQRKFADSYLLTDNATKSYLEVYATTNVKSAEANASRLLSNDKLAAYIAMRREAVSAKALKKYDISQDRIYEELCKMAFYDHNNFDIRHFISDEGEPIIPHELSDDAAIIAGMHRFGYKIPDKLKALETLMRSQGMFEKHQRAGQAVTVIKVPDINKKVGAGT